MAHRRDTNVQDSDALYAAIIDAHAGLTMEQSAALNARLVLLLANRVGDSTVVHEALAAARRSLGR